MRRRGKFRHTNRQTDNHSGNNGPFPNFNMDDITFTMERELEGGRERERER